MIVDIIIDLVQKWGRFFTFGFAKSNFDRFFFGILGFSILILAVWLVYRDNHRQVGD